MSNYHYESLSSLDNYFLLWENPNAYMHIGGTYIFEAGPLTSPDGGINVDAIRNRILASLHHAPRYRQKLAHIDSKIKPLWVDDAKFDIDYHIRHTSLPRPGDIEQLKCIAARIMCQHLDRSRPLWEIWVIEGLAENRFAMVAKVHHCMVDGISGVDLLTVLMSLTPETDIPAPLPFKPRPIPNRAQVMIDNVSKGLRLPFTAMDNARRFWRSSEKMSLIKDEALVRFKGLAGYLAESFGGVSQTPLNREIGPHRHFDWTSMPLEDIKTIRRALGGALNDVVLTIVAGGIRAFFQRRKVDVQNLDFRVMTPVSVRREAEKGTQGNRVSAWTIRLPLNEPDPAEQFNQIVAQTARLKESKQALGAEMITRMTDWTPSTLLAVGARHHYRVFPWNMVVTNVPGPQFPIYMNGCRMLDAFPHVPLLNNQGLNIALFSYHGRLFWCFNADYDLVPDIDQFTSAINESFRALLTLSAGKPNQGTTAG